MKKAQSTGNKYTQGMSTLEILIAFTILMLCLSAVMLVAFGNQSVVIDSQISEEAISIAQAMLEETRATAKPDFNLVNPFTQTETREGFVFDKTLEVHTSATDATLDLWTKKVTSSVSWQIGDKNSSILFTTLLTNLSAIDGGNTCSSVITGDWKNPQTESTIDFSSISPTGTYSLTDLDAYEGRLYVAAIKTDNKNDPTVVVFDINDPSDPKVVGQIDNDPEVKTGLNSVAVTNKYAFVASASSYVRGQMQVVDLESMSVVKTFKIPVVNSEGSSKGLGNSIFYKNKNVYLGLTKSTSEDEFNIINVSNPLDPIQIGRYPIGNAINATIVHDKYAYIASPNTQELQILDISNPNNPTYVGGFNAQTGAGHGKSIFSIGAKLYLGKTSGLNFDFIILDNSNPQNTPVPLDGTDVGTGNSVNEIIVRDYLSFVLTNKDLQIFNTSNPSSITPWGILTLPGIYDSDKPEPSMDCEGNRIFISSNNEGQGKIYIIKPSI